MKNNLTAAIHCPLCELSAVTILGRELFEAAAPEGVVVPDRSRHLKARQSRLSMSLNIKK